MQSARAIGLLLRAPVTPRFFRTSAPASANVQAGMKGEALTTCKLGQNTAAVMGSGDLEVFATPAMVALMEQAACRAIDKSLDANETTVGINITADHTKPTLPGAELKAVARVVSKEGNLINFSITVFQSPKFEGQLQVGRGTHTRALVDRHKFMLKAAAPAANS